MADKEQVNPIGPFEARIWLIAVVTVLGSGSLLSGIGEILPKPASASTGVIELTIRHMDEQLDRMEQEAKENNAIVASGLMKLGEKYGDLDRRMLVLEKGWENDTLRRADMAKAIEELRQKVSDFKTNGNATRP